MLVFWCEVEDAGGWRLRRLRFSNSSAALCKEVSIQMTLILDIKECAAQICSWISWISHVTSEFFWARSAIKFCLEYVSSRELVVALWLAVHLSLAHHRALTSKSQLFHKKIQPYYCMMLSSSSATKLSLKSFCSVLKVNILCLLLLRSKQQALLQDQMS